MTRKDRITLLFIVVGFIVLQLFGMMGSIFGTGKLSSVNYVGWAGYFIVIGAVTVMFLIVAILTFLIPPIFRGIFTWIERGKDEGDREETTVTGATVYNNYVTSHPSVLETVRERPEDDVQSDVSGCEPITGDQLTRRALRNHVALHVSG